MAKHMTRGLLRNVATDGSVAQLDPFMEQLCSAARVFAESDNAFSTMEARRLLADAAYYLVWNAREYVGERNRTAARKARHMSSAATTTTTKHPIPARADWPEMIFDPDTGLYDVVLHGCVTHGRLDVAGVRETIRADAEARIAADPELRAKLDAMPGGGAPEEPAQYAELRRLAEDVRANGDCGCSVVLSDGVVASLRLDIKDPWAK